MSANPATAAERVPRPGRYLIPGETPRRAELIAACALLAVLVHVLFAQLALILAVAFYVTTRLTRWRPLWLAAPAYLAGMGQHPGRLLHLGTAYAGMGHWLPKQLPLALIVASAEAAIAAWLSWLHT